MHARQLARLVFLTVAVALLTVRPSPLPAQRPVARQIPLGPMIERAYHAGTRDSSGSPGGSYWQQTVDYSIRARLDVDSAILHGEETVKLHTTSPDTLRYVVLRLYQNYFRAETERNDYVTDITDGVTVERLSIDGSAISTSDTDSYSVDGTIARVRPATPILPGATATIDVAWRFEVPNVPGGERGERMGRWGHELYQVAQWYPQVAMYDDLRGWDLSQYLGKGEFYNQFGSFDVRITVPGGWLVGATGTLTNPEEVLSPTTRDRLALAIRVDTTVRVVTANERGVGKATAAGASLTWHFTAPKVNDFAFVASKNFVYDAARAFAPDTTLVQVLYLPEHERYAGAAQLGRFALEHHSKLVMPYDFPQATIADGPETGMEYPMIIFSGPGFGVITHELGHEWFPMMVGSNETWYGWQDEGFNEFIDAAATADHEKKPTDWSSEGSSYRRIAGSELEPAMMWPTDFAGPYYSIQAYVKAPLALHALGGVVGDSAVRSAFAGYARAWRYKHPSPWDFFMYMDRALRRDLGWFWNSWWFTTQSFDQGIANVKQANGTLTLTVADHGGMPMPVIARVDFTDGSSRTITRPATVWFSGSRSTSLTLPLRGKSIAHVTLDPENRFQDLDRSNNEWNAKR
ncbi:MAG TPA: M1 family metallopeptidase [Gemmatimonadaceae bacterium]|nr:M1 family metallopeptidase [Gemmatimonadaceae bacterium]